VLTFLLFVLISAFFWAVLTWQEETTSDFTVAFVVRDQPENRVFTTQVPRQLRVTLADANMQLMRYSVGNDIDTLTVNFERYADALGNFRISAAELQSLLRESLENSTRIVRVSPALIDSRFSQAEGRKVAVRMPHEFSVADNHRLRPVSIEPDSVTVYAPRSVMDTLNYIYTMPSAHHALTDTLCETLPLDLRIGVKATPTEVRIMAPVAEYVEKVFSRMEVKTQHVPAGHQLVVFPYSVSLRCLVDFEEYRNVTEQQFRIAVDYDDIDQLKPGEHYLPIHVEYDGPKDVATHFVLSADKAEFVLIDN